jgi:Protein of unknown function (DUF1674)
MSTLRAGRNPEFGQSSVYNSVFLAKLPAMTHSDDQVPIEPLSKPDEGDQPASSAPRREVGGRDGPEPTRFGDWELRGRCIDF